MQDFNERLHELEQDISFSQAALDSQSDLLIFAIDRNYTYRTFNNAFKAATSFAYGTEVKQGMSLPESITRESDRKKAKANCDRALSGESHHTIEQYGSKHIAVYETFYKPVMNSDNEIIGVSVLSSNISARAVTEQQVKTLTKELESFTYTAAHDLRVPLRVINGYSRILSEDYRDVLDVDGQKLIDIIVSQVSHMGRLIDDLLTFAKLGKAQVVPRLTNLRDIAQQAIDEQKTNFPDAKTKFTIGDLPHCNCDPALIRIVFSNLISNAVKFSANSEAPIVNIDAQVIDDKTVYSVSDNGVGFNMEYSGKLFGLFQRLHKPAEFEGTGVGLAVVQRIVGKHGGRVWFEAELDKGATFYFTL